MKEFFLMFDIAPQAPEFNRGIWKSLEERVQRWTFTYDSLLILTEPVLSEIQDTIGTRNRILLPSYFYKIIIRIGCDELQAVAFTLPNREVDDDIYNYHVSIDYVEEKRG